MKFLISLFFVSILCSAGYGQTVCKDSTIQDISSRGIKLGMKTEEILNTFAESGMITTLVGNYDATDGKDKTITNEYPVAQAIVNSKLAAQGNYGLSSIALGPKDTIKFDGISRYDFSFIDQLVARFKVSYTKPKWENEQQFIKVASELIGLPIDERFLNRSPYKVNCGKHFVEFRREPNGTYSMSVSSDINEVIGSRSKQAADAQRALDIQAFKP